MSSLISFTSVLKFSIYSSFVSLGKFLPRYLIILVPWWNGIDSLIALSDFLLWVYRNANDFGVLILYHETFLNSLISSYNFLILSLGFSMYSIMSSSNSESFTSTFLIWKLFISFSSLTAAARTSRTMLNNSHQSGHAFSIWWPKKVEGQTSTIHVCPRMLSTYISLINWNDLNYQNDLQCIIYIGKKYHEWCTLRHMKAGDHS